MKIRMLILFTATALFSISPNVFGTTRYWVGSSSTNWNTAANWNGGTLPANGDVIYIANGTFAVGTNLPAISAAPAFTPASITIGNTKVITLTISAGFTLSVPTLVMSSTSNTSKISVAGILDINNVTMASATSIVLTTTGTIKLSGDIQGGTLDASANGSTVILDGTTAQSFPNTTTIGGSAIDYLDIYNTYYGSSTDRGVTLTGATVNQTTLEANAIFNANGTLTAGTGYMLTMKANSDYISKSTFTFRANDIIDPSGTIEYTSPTQIVNLYTPNAGQTNLPPNVIFTGTTIQVNSGTSPNTTSNFLVRGNLTSSGSTTVTFSGITTINIQGDFMGTSNIDLATNAIPVTIEGSWLNTATDAPTKLITYDGNVTGNTQVVSTAITYGAGLTMINASHKKVNSGTLAVTGTLTTSGGAVDLNTNDPTVTVTGSWVNAATVTQDAGPITITGNVTNNSGGTLSLGAANLSIAGNYTNNSGGVYSQGTGTTIFNGSAAQALSDVSTTGTTFNNVTFTGTSTANAKTMSGTGGFAVSGSGILKLTGTTTKVDAGGVLTLKSAATGSAAVDVISSGSSIIGQVKAERFLTGGGSLSNRGYRLLSSPVNQTSATLSTSNTIALSYLTGSTFNGVASTGAFTGGLSGPANGFSIANSNPTVYIYKESLPNSNVTFTSGKHLGVNKIYTSGGISVVDLSDNSTAKAIPVGNGFIMYFVGSNVGRASGSASILPTDAVLPAVGYLNQQSVTVSLWSAPGTGKLSNAAASLPGFNMVGNPYASTINLSTVLTQNNSSTGIDNIYLLSAKNSPNQTYIAYTAGGTSAPSAGYAVSGEGFLVHIKSTAGSNGTLTFNESQKSATTQLAGSALIMSAPLGQDLTASGIPTRVNLKPLPAGAIQPNTDVLTGLYMKIEQDSTTYDYCGIYFGSEWSANFQDGDALDLDGTGPRVLMSSFSADGIRSAVKHFPGYKKGVRIKLYAEGKNNGLYKLKIEGIRNMDTVNYKITLIDHFKKDSLDIGRYKTYAFNIERSDAATYGADRFELSIQQWPGSKYLLAAFTAQKGADGILVSWRAYNEGSNYFFTLQKKQPVNTNYAAVYQAQSNGATNYNYTDKTPNAGNNVYRLKQVDLFGNVSYSAPVSIYYDKSGNPDIFNVYPNPTAETLHVKITGAQTTTQAATYKLNIYDVTGTLLLQKTSGNINWSENVSQFKPGVYVVELKGDDGNLLGQVKFIKK